MFRAERKIRIIYLLIDLIFLIISFSFSYLFKYNNIWAIFSHNIVLPNFKEYLFIYILWIIFILSNFSHRGLYFTEREITIFRETIKTIGGVIYASVLVAMVIFFAKYTFFSRQVFITSFLLACFFLSLWRAIKRILLRRLIIKGFRNLNVLIVGAGKVAKVLVKEIESHPYLGLRIVGFLDDEKKGEVLGYRILGKIKDLETVVQKKFVDEIYITIPSEREKVARIINSAKKLKKGVRIVADNFVVASETITYGDEDLTDIISPLIHIKISRIGYIPLISYIEKGLHGSEQMVKRIFDIIVAGIALLILSPLFIIIAIAIKLDSPGPVFYTSLRCGRRGKVFKFYKFRSMEVDADKKKQKLLSKSDVKGPVFKMKNDPRVTRVGKFLRRYSLDELPQLINVIKGDMSLVGPRPPTPEEVAKYETWQLKRLDIKPGITSLWALRGRSDLSFYKWVKWDLWYINNWSFGLDLWILWNTIPAVLKGKGAY